MKRRVFLLGLVGSLLSGKAFATPAGKTEVAKILEKDPGNKVKLKRALIKLFRSAEYQRFAKEMFEKAEEEGEANDPELKVYWGEDEFVGYIMNQVPELYLELGLFEARCKKGKSWEELCENLTKVKQSVAILKEQKVISNFLKQILGEQGFRELVGRMYELQACLFDLADRYDLKCKGAGKAVS